MNNQNLTESKYPFLVIVVIYTFMFFSSYGFIADDAFITTVYSKNFIENGFPIFAPQLNEPVLGYTNFFIMVLQALYLKVFVLDIVVFYKALGFISGFFIIYNIVYFKSSPSLLSIIVGLLIAINPFFSIHANSGMETILFILFIILVLRRFFYKIYDLQLLFLMFCLTLIRPEGYIIVLVSVVYIFFTIDDIKKLVKYSILFTIFTLTYWGYLYYVYGTIIPNTFYVKSGNFILYAYSIESIYKIIKYIGIFVLPILLFDFYLSYKNKNCFKIYLYFLIVILSIFYLFANTNIMGFALRFYFPIFILLMISMITLEQFKYKEIIISSMLLMNYSLINKDEINNETEFLVKQYGAGLVKAHVAIGKDLNLLFPNNKKDFIAVFNDAGAIPYYSSINTIDAGFLNNKYLTNYKNNTGMIDLKYVFEKQPIAIVLTEKRDLISFSEGKLLASNSFFNSNYTLYKSYPFFSDIYEHVFIRNDIYNLQKNKL